MTYRRCIVLSKAFFRFSHVRKETGPWPIFHPDEGCQTPEDRPFSFKGQKFLLQGHESEVEHEIFVMSSASALNTVDSSVCDLQAEMERHLKDERRGERLRSGVQVVIAGATNAGKSSLLNTLCKRTKSPSTHTHHEGIKIKIYYVLNTKLCWWFGRGRRQHLSYYKQHGLTHGETCIIH